MTISFDDEGTPEYSTYRVCQGCGYEVSEEDMLDGYCSDCASFGRWWEDVDDEE